MSNTFIAKPVTVEAFQYGKDTQPLWFLSAIRKRIIKIMPSPGHIVAKTESGKINIYDPVTFNALFETAKEAKDLDKDGVVDSREKAIASETTKKKGPKAKKKKEPVKEVIQEDTTEE